jgi:hypothetical protein
MAYNNANMLRIAQIGAMTRPQFRNMPTLDLGGAVDNFTKARDKSLEAARRQAYVDELTAQHPEAAAQIAANPDAYAKMINDNAAAERDQQFKMDMLDKQFNNSIALQDRQHANAVGLAKLRMDLENQAGERAKTQRMAQLDEALKNGMISQEQYNMAKQRELLGDIVSGIPANLPDGTPLTGNKAYDDAYMKEVGKKTAQVKQAEADANEMKPALIQAMARADKAARSGSGVGFIGGTAANFGLNPLSNAGANYADIQSANTQMNTYLRKQLAATGLTGSELNSAVEAEAYRYQIKPTDSESIIRRKLQNFAQDKLGGSAFNLNTGQALNQPAAVDYKNKYGLE